MEFVDPNSSAVCRPEDIGGYLDGELSANRELELDLHFANCARCLDELNRQKDMMRVLDENFDLSGAPELPEILPSVFRRPRFPTLAASVQIANAGSPSLFAYYWRLSRSRPSGDRQTHPWEL